MTDWFRSWHGAPSDPKWRTIARRAGARPGDVFAVVWSLYDRASQAKDRGSIAGVDAEVMADALGYEVEIVEAIMSVLREKGVVADDRITAWDKYQPKREREDAGSTERSRDHRSMQRAIEDGDNEQRHAPPRDATQRTEKSREEEKRVESKEVKEEAAPSAAPRPRRKAPTAKIPIPSDYSPNETTKQINAEHGFTAADLASSTQRMVAWAKGEGKLKADWDATHQNWIRSNAERRGTGPPGSAGQHFSASRNGNHHDPDDQHSVHRAAHRLRDRVRQFIDDEQQSAPMLAVDRQ